MEKTGKRMEQKGRQQRRKWLVSVRLSRLLSQKELWDSVCLVLSNLLKLIRTSVWPLTVNLSLPSTPGGSGWEEGGEGEKEEGTQGGEEVEEEKRNWVLIPIRAIIGIWDGDLFISRCWMDCANHLNWTYLMFKQENQPVIIITGIQNCHFYHCNWAMLATVVQSLKSGITLTIGNPFN